MNTERAGRSSASAATSTVAAIDLMAPLAAALDGAPEGAVTACRVLVPDLNLNSGQRLAEGDRLAVGLRPRRAPGQSQVERLEEVRLAGAFAPHTSVRPSLSATSAGVRLRKPSVLTRRARIGAAPPQTFSRIGITR